MFKPKVFLFYPSDLLHFLIHHPLQLITLSHLSIMWVSSQHRSQMSWNYDLSFSFWIKRNMFVLNDLVVATRNCKIGRKHEFSKYPSLKKCNIWMFSNAQLRTCAILHLAAVCVAVVSWICIQRLIDHEGCSELYWQIYEKNNANHIYKLLMTNIIYFLKNYKSIQTDTHYPSDQPLVKLRRVYTAKNIQEILRS